jgi:hypothetical protein
MNSELVAVVANDGKDGQLHPCHHAIMEGQEYPSARNSIVR